MKKLLTICIFILLTALLTAQVSKTVNVATAGTLTNLLTATEKTTVTDLTVTGNLDARDVKCMRNEITNLAFLDISAVTIMAYIGTSGTSTSTSYPANEMPEYSFYNGYSDTGKTTLKTVLLPNSITSISSFAFYKCRNLTGLVLPNSLITIGYYAFCFCDYLTNLIIPNSVVTIVGDAFLSCHRLTNITLGSAVTSIGGNAFYDCNIQIINSLNTTPPTLGVGCFAYNSSPVSAVYVPASAVTAYKSAPGWSDSFMSVIQKFQYRVSLKDASTGTMNLICDNYGATPSFDFTPATGWKVNTVLYNGVDVTSSLVDGVFTVPALTDNALLNVSLVSTSSGAPELISNRVKVYSTRSEIIIDGTFEGETVTLYTLNGKQLQTVKSQGERLNIPVDRDAVYLVKTGERTFKVIL